MWENHSKCLKNKTLYVYKLGEKCASNENECLKLIFDISRENHSHLDVSFLSKLNGITILYLRVYIHWSLQYIELQFEFLFIGSWKSIWNDMKKEIIFMCGFDTLIIGRRRSETLQVATVILKSIIMACSFYGGHCFFRYLSIMPSGVVKKLMFSLQKSRKVALFHIVLKIAAKVSCYNMVNEASI